MIWRRLLISRETSIAQLHEYVQICFDWNNEHLHCFRIKGKNYGIAYLGGMSFDDNLLSALPRGTCPRKEVRRERMVEDFFR
jgi:hypothetical protein